MAGVGRSGQHPGQALSHEHPRTPTLRSRHRSSASRTGQKRCAVPKPWKPSKRKPIGKTMA
jgi:hypothetical protein